MLRAAMIGPETVFETDLLPYLQNIRGLSGVKVLNRYPSDQELERFIRATFPRLIFLSMRDLKKAEYIARWVRQFAPGTQLVGVADNCGNEILRAALRAGLLECLALPLDAAHLGEAIDAAEKLLAQSTDEFPNRGRVLSFLPAKPGVGASTIALNTSLAVSHLSSGRVLLADFDLNLGLQGFMLKLDRVHSAQEAGEHAHHIDADIWEALLVSKGKLDILGSGYMSPGQRIETGAARDLLGFWRRNYELACLDHSGNMERYSIELLMDSEEILLVSTPEIAPLHLAKTKVNQLREYGLHERVSLVLNRVSRRDTMTKEDVEAAVGVPVVMQIPNDYAKVELAVRKGTGVDPESPLGRRYEALASLLLKGKARRPVESAEPPASKVRNILQLDGLFSRQKAGSR
ncbi:MAG: hypothetical protein NW208_06615 [Bryobacter sp.]|nr:hypothetical protein [Bryobacter sp.]